MKKKSLVVILIAILMLTACSSQKNLNSFFFLQMADTQFGFFTDNKDFQRETLNFEKAIAQANRLRPEFVVVCGDLVNKPGDNEQIHEYKRIASTLNPSMPIYNVAGNHDVGNIPTPQSLAAYREDFGPDYYAFEKGDLFAIVVNSSLMKDPDSARHEAAAQDEWLKATLKRAHAMKNKRIIVFMHHSLFLESQDEKDQYFNFATPKRMRYLNLFKDNGVQYIFAGHYHRNALGRAGHLEMVTTGPVGRPLGSDPSGFRIVTVERDAIRHAYFSLDSIPKVIR